MPKKLRDPVLTAPAESPIEALRNIAKLCVCRSGADASGALSGGAILLAISRVDNDKNGDGFRYLLGLPQGVEITPLLGNLFR